jgi:radical SAM superfamily enzyme YgiQ (UPF0313 family)
MKIKLIAPARKPEWGESFWDLKTLCKLTGRKAGGAPLALPTLAALTPSDVEVVLTDENVEPIDFDEKVDLVGITGMTCVIPRSYEIADEYRKRGVPVVMGGIHVSMLPEEAIQHCNSVVIGEAEEIWEEVVKDVQKKNLQKFYRAPRFPDLTHAPIPRWDLLKNKFYPIFPIQTGRGCPFDCDFCSVQTFNGRQYRYRKTEDIIREIETLQAIEYKKPIFFVDDNLLAVSSYAQKLLESLLHFRFKWWCQASVSGLKDDKILDLMYRAGCREIFIGFESVSQDSLQAMHKSPVNKAKEYKEIINKIHSHGMAVFASFILGSDSDNKNIFGDTADFIDDTAIAFSMINILTPPPGTVLYDRLSKENRLSTKDWWKFNGENVCFKPLLITNEELQNSRNRLLFNIFSYENIYKRFKKLWSYKIYIRKDIRRKLRTRSKIYIFLKGLFYARLIDVEKMLFMLKFLFISKPVSIFSIVMALNFHDYAYKKRTIS